MEDSSFSLKRASRGLGATLLSAMLVLALLPLVAQAEIFEGTEIFEGESLSGQDDGSRDNADIELEDKDEGVEEEPEEALEEESEEGSLGDEIEGFEEGEELLEKTLNARSSVAIDAIAFPDANFMNFILNNLDGDGDGFLSDAEIAAVTSLDVSSEGIADLTGINLFHNLTTLLCKNNNLTSIDVSGLSQLTEIRYGGNNFLELDFRANTNLQIAHHSTNGETVYISAGMTSFVGCDVIPSHTGNIVIDLDGHYVVNPDGSKSIDLNTILNPVIINQIIENSSSYDQTTGVLTIPATQVTTTLQASSGNVFTFHTRLSGHTVDFMVDNVLYGSISVANGGIIAAPTTNPVKEGYIFTGWYFDPAATQPYDFDAPVYGDLVLHAGWNQEAVTQTALPKDPTPASKPQKLTKTSDSLENTVEIALASSLAAFVVVCFAGRKRLKKKGSK